MSPDAGPQRAARRARQSAGPRERLEGKRVVICAGSGGVGKTTTSAALAMGLAAEGRRVAVVTIDPARRLANSLGLEELGNEPALVEPGRLAGHGLEMRGELWAMMLDAKRTFDELIERLAPDERTRDDVLGNRIYQQLSGAVAGSQEFTAVAKLYDLDRSGRFDVLVLDTPPSRNALDFLDAPDRLTSFFEGRALRVFLAPTGLAARVVGRGTSVVFSVLKRAHRRRPARGPRRLLPRAGRSHRRLQGARGGRQAAARRPVDDVPHRHLARARARRGGDLLPRQAARRRDGVRRARRQPRPRARRRGPGCARARRGRAARGAGRQAGRQGRAHVGGGARPDRARRGGDRAPQGRDRRARRRWSCPSSRATSTTSTGWCWCTRHLFA